MRMGLQRWHNTCLLLILTQICVCVVFFWTRCRTEVFADEILTTVHSSKMQQSMEQVGVTLAQIARVRERKGVCNLLIFGVGFDAAFWMHHNRQGRTVFLEDSAEWSEFVRARMPPEYNMSVYGVHYKTLLGRDDATYLDRATWPHLFMELPEDILETEWDIILVDAPAGYKKGKTPGRYQALYMAARLRRPADALTVVDDCERHVERTYGDLFLGNASAPTGSPFLIVARSWRLVFSSFNPLYNGNQQCFYRGIQNVVGESI